MDNAVKVHLFESLHNVRDDIQDVIDDPSTAHETVTRLVNALEISHLFEAEPDFKRAYAFLAAVSQLILELNDRPDQSRNRDTTDP